MKDKSYPIRNPGSSRCGPKVFTWSPPLIRVYSLRWSDLRAWEKSVDNELGWKGTSSPHFNVNWALTKPGPRASRRQLLFGEAIREHIPRSAVELVGRFGAAAHWHLLRILSRIETAWGLADNPGLLFLVAHHWHFKMSAGARRRKVDVARRLVKMRRRAIAARLLGIEESESVVRILRRVAPSITLSRMRSLGSALRSEAVRRALCHCPVVHAGVIRVVSDRVLFQAVTATALQELSRRRRTTAAVVAIRDAVWMARTLRRRIPKIRSVAHGMRLHDELLDWPEDSCGEIGGEGNVSYGAPPFPAPEVQTPDGVISWHWILDREHLRRWGRETETCLARSPLYEKRILRRTSAIAALSLGRERATLEISRVRTPEGDRWVVAQLSGHRNARPRALRHVARWVRENLGPEERVHGGERWTAPALLDEQEDDDLLGLPF